MFKIIYIPNGEIIDENFKYRDLAEGYIRFLVCMKDQTTYSVMKEEFEVINVSNDPSINNFYEQPILLE